MPASKYSRQDFVLDLSKPTLKKASQIPGTFYYYYYYVILCYSLEKKIKLDDNKDNYDRNEMEIFHNNSMYFLKYPKEFTFNKPCNLELTKYSFKVINVSKIDLDCLTSMVSKMNADFPKIRDGFFISFKKCIFYNAKGEQMFPSKLKISNWMIKIELQGYKISSMQRWSPVWTLISCQDCESNLPDCGDDDCLHGQ